MPVITEQQSLIESNNDDNNNNTIKTLTIEENSSKIIGVQKFSTNFPQLLDKPIIEPLYPVDIKSRTNDNNNKTPSSSKISNGINGNSGNSSPLEIIGQTTGQLTKTTEFSPSLSYSSINSFQIINPDTLHIINPKPNAIVRPVRRSNDSYLNNNNHNNDDNDGGINKKNKNNNKNGKIISKIFKTTYNNNNNNNKVGDENSQLLQIGSNLNQNQNILSMKNKKLKFDQINGSVDYNSLDDNGEITSTANNTTTNYKKSSGFFAEMANFAKELNQKLHRLRNDKTSPTRSSSKNSTYPNNESHNKRPLFITTVPSGVFLPPAKEISPTTTQKRIYAFSTRPKIFTIYRSNNNNYPTAGGYYTQLDNNNSNDTKLNSTNSIDNIDGKDNNDKAKASLNERIKRDVFRGNGDIRPYNYYRNNATSLNGSIKSLLDKKDQMREPLPPQPYKNVMYDRRVVRGSNFSQGQFQPWNPYFSNAALLSGKEQQIYTKEQEAKRRLMLRKRCLARNQRNVIGSPPPIPGRVHIPIQTDKYLEELFDRPPEYDANTQTDLFLQRPPSPPYIPAKIGIDCATQIEKGELFDFDSEAQPILDTLVGHSVQQSLIETLHEQEMAELKAKQEELLARREAELAELQRLEEEERQMQEEKKRRLISKEFDTILEEEVTAAKLLEGHIATILPDVLQKLEPQTDLAHKNELESKICPWLSKEVAEEVGKIIDSREILTEIIKEIIIQRASVYAGYNIEGGETDDEIKNSDEEDNNRNDVIENDNEFIRNEINCIIEKAENKELGTEQDDNTDDNDDDDDDDISKLETIKEENNLVVKQDKEMNNFINIENNNEIELRNEESFEETKIEKLVQNELMEIISKVVPITPSQQLIPEICEDLKEKLMDEIITDDDDESIDNLNIEISNDENKFELEKQIESSKDKEKQFIDSDNNDDDDDDDNDDDDEISQIHNQILDPEIIVRNEIERIVSLAESIDDETIDVITQIEFEHDNKKEIELPHDDNDNDNTENDDIDNYYDNDDDHETNEEFLRNEIETMISNIVTTSTNITENIS